ncbi:flagellar motor protein MotB [Niallia sp. 03133]|uniref:flagellar motor protein MotB n=1 Tax=Niallia sp. 03133 TaxID=3458060 RepID=UPI004043C20C
MSKRRKKKEHHDEHMDESWLVPYSDLLTLLLALFIVLYAMSSVDAKKFAALANVFNKEFQSGTGIFEYPSPAPSPVEQNVDIDNLNKKQEKTVSSSITEEELRNIQKQQEQNELKNIQEKVNSYINEKKLTDKLETSLTDEGLLVSIRDNVLFASGSAEIRNHDKNVVAEISKLLVMDPPRSIIISGHTDNVPIHNSKYESNWELSVSRAINFMKLLLKNDQLDPSAFSAKGYGEFKPIASNKTEKGREKNRRVEILIQPRSPKN